MWLGSASTSDHVRCAGGGVRHGVDRPGVAAGSGAVPTSAADGRDRTGQRWAGIDRGRGVHRVAVCGRGGRGRWVRGASRRAGRYAGRRGVASGTPRPIAATARLLRELLADGRLPASWIPPTVVLEWRERARLYKTLVDQRSTWVQRIHAELCQHGVTVPETSIRWAKTRELLEDDGLKMSPAGRQRILTAYPMIDAITVESRPLKADLQRFGRHQPGCGALVDSQYGIGGLLAVAGACSSNTRSSILSSLDCSPHPHRILKHGWAADCPISGADIAHLPRPPTPAPRRCVD